MEPITLCGLVIVIFVAWIELEAILHGVARAVVDSMMASRAAALVSAMRKPVCANRYVPYPG